MELKVRRGKNDFLTPKTIANRIKSKGLQKLRWYCQMCQKQCRDENGFRCHCTSDSHQRQMEIFGQNPTRIVAGYSAEFERLFLDQMRHNHRIAATVVYNEYIADHYHVHMNATQWATLTKFVEHLGKTEKCKVEETPKGLFITYIDPHSKSEKKRNRPNLADEEKQEREIKKQREQLMGAGDIDDHAVELPSKLESEKKIKLTLWSTSRRSGSSKSVFDEMDNEKREGQARCTRIRDVFPVLDEIMREEDEETERNNRKDYWLCVGIIVKVMSNASCYKQKGIVRKVFDKYVAEIEMIETKHVVRVDQKEVETVIPQIGGLVRIVNGAYRGSNARLLAVDTKATVQIERGIYEGKVLKAIDYEDISKIAECTRIKDAKELVIVLCRTTWIVVS